MESKYAKFIITKPGPERPGHKNGPDVRASMAYLDGNVLPGAFYCETHWYKGPTHPTPNMFTILMKSSAFSEEILLTRLI